MRRETKIANRRRIKGENLDIKGFGNVISGKGHNIKGNNNVCDIHFSEVTGRFEDITGTYLKLFVDESTLNVSNSTVIGFGNKIKGKDNEISGEGNKYDTKTNISLTIERSQTQPQERKNIVVIEEIDRGPDLFSDTTKKTKPIRNLALPMKVTRDRKRRDDVQQQEQQEVLLPHELIELANFVNGLQHAEIMIEGPTERKEEKKIISSEDVILPLYAEGEPAPQGSYNVCPVCIVVIPNCILNPCGHGMCIPCLYILKDLGKVKCSVCKARILGGIRTWK